MGIERGKQICNFKCGNYIGGEIGLRFCCGGFWDERKAEKLPKLNNDGAVLIPWECVKKREEGKHGRSD
jgi:hypothetical protein